MTDLVITAADVLAGSNSAIEDITFGATVTQGVALYKEASSGKHKLADNDSGTAEVKGFDGIALTAGSDGQPGKMLKYGDIDLGATLVPGTAYYLSDTAGGIMPAGDLGAGMDVIFIGHATSTSILNVRAFDTGVTLSA